MIEEAVVRLRLDTGNVVPASGQAADALAKIGTRGEVSAKQTAAAMRQLPAQLTDVATQLAGGQNPLLILLQQGGQVKDQFGGIGPAVRGIGAAAAAINPLTYALGAAAAAAGALAFGFVAGSNESIALRRSLATTGNQAGTTLAQIDALSRGIAESGRVTIGNAREMTAGLVALGTLGGPALDAAAQAAGALAAATGKSAEEVVKELALAAEAPTQFAQKANQAYRFLTAAQYDQIRSLEAQGRTQEAARLGLELLAQTMQQRAVPALGLMDRTVQEVKNSWSAFVDMLKSVGREDTAEERLRRINEQLAELQKAGQKKYVFGPSQEQLAAERDSILNLTGRDAIRAADRSIAQRREDDKIRESTTQHQQALGAIEKAGGAYRLAEQQRQLSIMSSMLEDAFQQDELSARAYQSTRLTIDLAGINAQAAALARQRAAEGARKPGTPEETLAQKAALLQLDAQALTLQEKRAKLLADEAAGRRDIAPKSRETPADALRRLKGVDYEAVDQYLEQRDAQRVQLDRQTLQDLRDQNERAGILLIDDERLRGEKLIELDQQIARRRLSALNLSPGAASEAGGLLTQQGDLQRTQLNRELSRGTYEDLRGAIAAALQTTTGNPIRNFASTLGRAVYARMTEALADSFTRAALFGNGNAGGSGSGLWGLLGGLGGSGGSANLGTTEGWYDYGVDGSHASGLAYVPFDGYRAMLHRGERVLTAAEARTQDTGAPKAPVQFITNIRGDASSNTVAAIRNEQSAFAVRMQRSLG